MIKDTKFIANTIIELRNSVNWSQSELARRCRVTSAAISQIEKGDRMPSLRVLRKLAEVFQVSLDQLIGNEQLPPPDHSVAVFLRKFGELNNLSEEDQNLIQSIIKRLNEI